LAAATAAAAVALVVAGCSTSGGGTNTPNAEDTGPATLTFWNTGSDDEATVMQAAADLYQQSHPNTTIKVQAIPWDDGHARVLTAAQSRSGPDIISGGLSWGIEFGKIGGMVDLRDFGVTSIQPQIEPGVWKSIVSTDQKVFGVPMDMTAYLLYYRTDLLQSAGVAGVPKTWDELTAAIDKLKAKGVKTPFAMTWGTLGWLQYFNFLKEAGGSLYAPDCSKPTIDSDQAVRALQFMADLHNRYGAPQTEPDLAGGLDKGDIAMVTGGTWNVNAIDPSHPTVKGKWATAALPAGPSGPGSFIGGRIIGAMSYTRYKSRAADFIKWLYTDPAVNAVQTAAAAKGILWLSPRADMLPKISARDDVKTALSDVFASAEGPPNCPGWEQSQAEVEKKIQSVIVSKTDAKKALTEAAQIMTSNLSQ